MEVRSALELALMILEKYAASGTDTSVHRSMNISDVFDMLRFK